MKCYIGVDVGGGTIKYGVFNQNKKLIDKFAIDTFETVNDKKIILNEKNLIVRILSAIDDYANNNKHNIAKKDIIGIGYDFPGPVYNNHLFKAVNINWKNDFDIVKATNLWAKRKIAVRVLNDANAAALGEYHNGLDKKYEDMCMLTLGTAVGGGIIICGKIIEGRTGLAGEISHIKVDFSKTATPCKCGSIGCLETVAGGLGLSKVHKKNTKSVKTAKEILDLAKVGDKKCLASVNESFSYISYVIEMLMLTYEPQVIVIGGGVSRAGSIITDIIKKQVKQMTFMTKKIPSIILAKLKNDAGIYGAVSEL